MGFSGSFCSISQAERRKIRVRKKMRAPGLLRISVFRSNRNFYVQLIDVCSGFVLSSASTLEKGFKNFSAKSGCVDGVSKLAELFVSRVSSVDLSDKKLVFDRGSYSYGGNVAKFANALREFGLKF